MFDSNYKEYQASAAAALRLFNLSSLQINVYVRLMQFGPRSAGRIAKLCGINRSYTYDILESLVQKGLVAEFEQNKLRHFRCADPHLLISALEQHEKEMAIQIEKLKKFAGAAS